MNNGIKLNNFASYNENIEQNKKIIPQSNFFNNRNECNNENRNTIKQTQPQVLYYKNRKNNNYSDVNKEYYKNYYANNNNLNEILDEQKVDTRNEIYTNIKKSYINIDSNNRNRLLFPENNQYEMELDRSYTNVKQINIVSSEFPNTALTIEDEPEDIKNDEFIWQNFERNALKIYDFVFRDLSTPFVKILDIGAVFCDVSNTIMQYYLNPINKGHTIFVDLIKQKIAAFPSGLYLESYDPLSPYVNPFVGGVTLYNQRDIRSITIDVKDILEKLSPNDNNDPFYQILLLKKIKGYFDIYIQNIIKAGRLKIFNSTLDVRRNLYFNKTYTTYNKDVLTNKINYLDGDYIIRDINVQINGTDPGELYIVQTIDLFIQIYFYTGEINDNTINNYNILREGQYMLGAYLRPLLPQDLPEGLRDRIVISYPDFIDKIPTETFNNYPLTSRYIKENYYGYISSINLLANSYSIENGITMLYDPNNIFQNFKINIDSGDYDDEEMKIELNTKMNKYLQLSNFNDSYNVNINSKINKSSFSMTKKINLSTKRFFFRKYYEIIDNNSNSTSLRKHFVIFLYYDDHNLMENELVEINIDNNLLNTVLLKSSYDRLFNIINNKKLRAHLCKFYSLSHYPDPSNGTIPNPKSECWRDFKNSIIDIYKWNNLPQYYPLSHNFFYIDIEEHLYGSANTKDYFIDIDDYGMGYQIYTGMTSGDMIYQYKIPNEIGVRDNLNTWLKYFDNTKTPFPTQFTYDEGLTGNTFISSNIIISQIDITNYSINLLKKTKIIYDNYSPNNIIGFNLYDKPSDVVKKTYSIINYRAFYTDNVGVPRRFNVIDFNSPNHQLNTNDYVTINDYYSSYTEFTAGGATGPIESTNLLSIPRKINVLNDNEFHIIVFNNDIIFENYPNTLFNFYRNDQLTNDGYIYINNFISQFGGINLSDITLSLCDLPSFNLNNTQFCVYDYKIFNTIQYYRNDFIVSNDDYFKDFTIITDYNFYPYLPGFGPPIYNDCCMVINSLEFLQNLISNADENDIIPFQLIFDTEKTYYKFVDNNLVQVPRPSEIELFNKYNEYIIIPTEDEIKNRYKMISPLNENQLYFGVIPKLQNVPYYWCEPLPGFTGPVSNFWCGFEGGIGLTFIGSDCYIDTGYSGPYNNLLCQFGEPGFTSVLKGFTFGETYGNTMYLYYKYEDALHFYNNPLKRIPLGDIIGNTGTTGSEGSTMPLGTSGYGRYEYNLKNIIKFYYPNHCLYTFNNTARISNIDLFSSINEFDVYRKNKDEYFVQVNKFLNDAEVNELKTLENKYEIISDYNGHYINCSNYSKENIPQRKINYQPNKYILVKSDIISNTKPDLINNYNLDELNDRRLQSEKVNKVDNLFTKISLNSSNSIIFDSYMCNSKVYNETPINSLNKIDFSFYREDGKLFNFKQLEHSFTLEITEYIDELKNINYSSLRGMKDTIGYNKDVLCNFNNI
jgi:hypothetical protein